MKDKKNIIKCLVFIGISWCFTLNQVLGQVPNEKNDTIQKDKTFDASKYIIPRRRGAEKFESKMGVEHLYFSIGTGVEYLPDLGSGDSKHGFRGSIYAGNWMTPVVGIRGGFDYSTWNDNDVQTNRIGVSADYLINISAFAARYNPRRLFEVVGIIGASYQAHITKGNKAVQSYGLHIGLQGKFNISPAFNLFIEPQLGLYPDRIDREYSWRQYDILISSIAGITYKPAGFSQSWLLRNGFASISAGMCNMGDISVNTELTLGKWFGKPFIHGLRICAGSSTAFLDNYDGKGNKDYNVNVFVDYMLNLTTLFSDKCKRDRLFDFIYIGGIGNYFPGGDATASIAFIGRTGFQAHASLSEHMGIWIEPRINIYQDKSFRSDMAKPLRGSLGLMVGTSYKF